MRSTFKKSLPGFTIVEVLVVLAVAGLILATVFLAVPQLQRNSRDQARKNIALRLKNEIETYASNSQGTYPFTNVNATCPGSGGSNIGDWGDFYARYITASNTNLNDPSSKTPIIGCKTAAFVNTTTSYIDSFTNVDDVNGNLDPNKAPSKAGVTAILTGAYCLNGAPKASTGNNAYAIVVGLDTANVRYCVDNS